MKKVIFLLFFLIISFSCLSASKDGFNEWKKTFEKQAVNQNISQNTLNKYFAQSSYLEAVIQADRKQPEFTLTFTKYMKKAVTQDRIIQARQLWTEKKLLLQKIQDKYDVPAHYLLAFWALETNFGTNKGQFPIISALATLSYDERRSAFFTEQLITMLKILQKQSLDAPVSSWAGAFGHFQFMPSTFFQYAVDENHDGKIDICNDFEDAIGSAANYLSKMGWQKGTRWGREVTLTNSDVLKHIDEEHPLSFWQKMGVQKANGSSFKNENPDMLATLLLPQGVNGPAFLIYKNFKIIKRWNNSDLYAFAIGILADKIVGNSTIDVTQIKHEKSFSRTEIQLLQQSLQQKGIYFGNIDGVLGRKTKTAIKEYQTQQRIVPDGFLSENLFQLITENKGERDE